LREAEHVGQRLVWVTADTYSHVLVDEAELDYAGLLGRAVSDALKRAKAARRRSLALVRCSPRR
jgi:hypothetical protein